MCDGGPRDAEAAGKIAAPLRRYLDLSDLVSVQLGHAVTLADGDCPMPDLVGFVLDVGCPAQIAEMSIPRIAIMVSDFMGSGRSRAMKYFTDKTVNESTALLAAYQRQDDHRIALMLPPAQDATGENARAPIATSDTSIRRSDPSVGRNFIKPFPLLNVSPNF
jgi:hypothetical protein